MDGAHAPDGSIPTATMSRLGTGDGLARQRSPKAFGNAGGNIVHPLGWDGSYAKLAVAVKTTQGPVDRLLRRFVHKVF